MKTRVAAGIRELTGTAAGVPSISNCSAVGPFENTPEDYKIAWIRPSEVQAGIFAENKER